MMYGCLYLVQTNFVIGMMAKHWTMIHGQPLNHNWNLESLVRPLLMYCGILAPTRNLTALYVMVHITVYMFSRNVHVSKFHFLDIFSCNFFLSQLCFSVQFCVKFSFIFESGYSLLLHYMSFKFKFHYKLIKTINHHFDNQIRSTIFFENF